MNSITKLLIFLLSITMLTPAWGAKDYALKPIEITPGTYVLLGKNEHFSFRNGGNIVNTGFIVTDTGVIVIDTGPSRLYGEQLRTAIEKTTDKPIIKIFNTHLHPDHILGNQAFDDIPITALSSTIAEIGKQGEMFNDSMYRLVGAWMAGTRVVVPTQIAKPGVVEVGGHRLRLIEMDGHSHADLVILDETTGVLFASDIVFHGRTPTTPHADIARWMLALDKISSLKFKLLVPGHGHVVSDSLPIVQTRDYLQWLNNSLSQAAESGKTMAEVLEPEAPPAISNLAVFHEEYQRSVAHLFPDIEEQALNRGRVEQD